MFIAFRNKKTVGFCLAHFGECMRPAVLNRRGYLEIKNYYQLGEEELEANEEVLLLRPLSVCFFSPLQRQKAGWNLPNGV